MLAFHLCKWQFIKNEGMNRGEAGRIIVTYGSEFITNPVRRLCGRRTMLPENLNIHSQAFSTKQNVCFGDDIYPQNAPPHSQKIASQTSHACCNKRSTWVSVGVRNNRTLAFVALFLGTCSRTLVRARLQMWYNPLLETVVLLKHGYLHLYSEESAVFHV